MKYRKSISKKPRRLQVFFKQGQDGLQHSERFIESFRNIKTVEAAEKIVKGFHAHMIEEARWTGDDRKTLTWLP